MKSLLRTLFTLALLQAITSTGFSQSVKSDEDDREPSRIGYGVNIGNIRFYNRAFEFGLAPNVAYRLTESLSAGFMLKVDYFFEKYPAYDAKFSAFDLGPTFFTRLKPLWSWDDATPFLQGIFIQAEYEHAFLTRPFVYPDGSPVIGTDGKVEKGKVEEDFVYVGLGLSNGYPFSTFVSIHYNVLDNSQSLRFPFNYRIGFTYNY